MSYCNSSDLLNFLTNDNWIRSCSLQLISVECNSSGNFTDIIVYNIIQSSPIEISTRNTKLAYNQQNYSETQYFNICANIIVAINASLLQVNHITACILLSIRLYWPGFNGNITTTWSLTVQQNICIFWPITQCQISIYFQTN